MKLFVTGQRDDGTSAFLDERLLQPIVAQGFGTLENVPLWAAASLPSLPYTGTAPALHEFFPPPGAFRYFYLTIRPEEAEAALPTDEDLTNFDRQFPELLSKYEADTPGMHTTDTVDFIAIVEGTIVLDLGDVGERTLTQGDTLVQHGVRHRWRNDGSKPATLLVFMLGVARQR